MSGTECVRMVAQKLLAGSSSLGALEALLLPRGPTSHFSRLAAPTATQRALDRARRESAWRDGRTKRWTGDGGCGGGREAVASVPERDLE